MTDKSQLLEFGFSESKVTLALKKTKNSGLQAALDWLQLHADDPDTVEGEDEDDDEMEGGGINVSKSKEGDEEGAPGGAAEAKSLKCLECNKVFRNTALASYHGEKSGHSNFEESTEEIKPLTEAEKAAKLEELKSRMLAKKAQKSLLDIEESKSNERMRRKGGQDESVAKAELALKEANKDALQRKADKIADTKAKAAVREQILADKLARAAKSAREKALRDGTPLPSTSVPTNTSTSSTSTNTTTTTVGGKKVYETTRLQIRLPGGGNPLVFNNVEVGKTIRDLKELVVEGGYTGGEIVFSSTFPRKVFGSEDDNKTLEELGLVPSAVLIIQ